LPRLPQEALRRALELAGKRCVNRYTSDFSLPSDVRPRHEVIADAVRQLPPRRGVVSEPLI